MFDYTVIQKFAIHIRTLLYANRTVCNTKRISCFSSTRQRSSWIVAPIGTHIDNLTSWNYVDASIIDGSSITFNSRYAYDNATYACRLYDSDMMVGIELINVYWYDNYCDCNSSYCLNRGICMHNNKYNATCTCPLIYTGHRCGEISITVLIVIIVINILTILWGIISLLILHPHQYFTFVLTIVIITYIVVFTYTMIYVFVIYN